MSDLDMTAPVGQKFSANPATFSVEEIFWGYKIRSNLGAPLGLMLAQVISFFFGACLLTAAFGLFVMPSMMFSTDVGAMRIGVAVLFAGLAAYLLWFASRGTKSELHVDTSLGEIREVISNRAGRPSTVGVYGFDTIGGVFLEQAAREDGMMTLVLRYRNTAQTVPVAIGTEAQLMGLRDRLANDLMVLPEPMATMPRRQRAA